MKQRILAPALAGLALASATTAQAQQQACVQSADFADAVIYAMPIAYDAVSVSCGKQLGSDGFIARDKGRFIKAFRERQDAAWPGAFRLLKTFMAKDAAAKDSTQSDIGAMIASLPESSLRPFVHGMVGQMIGGEIKPDSCGKIDRGMELLSPLPPENIAGLLTFVLELSDAKNPEICPANPPRAAR